MVWGVFWEQLSKTEVLLCYFLHLVEVFMSPRAHPSILSGGREGIVYLRFNTTFLWKWSCWFCFFDGNILRCFFQLDLQTPLFTEVRVGTGRQTWINPPLLSVSCFQFTGQIRPRSGSVGPDLFSVGTGSGLCPLLRWQTCLDRFVLSFPFGGGLVIYSTGHTLWSHMFL